MARERLPLDRPASPDEIASRLMALAGELRRGLVILPGEARTLRLPVPAEVRLELAVKRRGDRGRISVALSWKRETTLSTGPLDGRPGPAG